MKRTLLTLATAVAALILPAALCVGCLDDLPSVTQIEGLRVMAVMTSLPEVMPGQTVELLPLVVDTEGRALSYRWSACLLAEQAFQGGGGGGGGGRGGGPPGSAGSGFVEDPGNCNNLLDAGDEDVTDLGTGPTATLAVPADFFGDFSVVAEAYGLPKDVPAELLTGLAFLVGVNITVSLDVSTPDGVVLSVFKRVKVSLSLKPNTNPVPMVFQLRKADSEGEPLVTGQVPADGKCFVGEENGQLTVGKGEWQIVALNIPEEPEKYEVLGISANPDDEPFQLLETEEELAFSFFTRGGELETVEKAKAGFTGSTWTFEEPPESDVIPLWIVTRDGRGGTVWCHSELIGDPTDE